MLAEHIRQSGETQTVWAERIRVSRSYLNHLMSGRRKPSLTIALRIESATGGAVPARSWEDVCSDGEAA